MAEGILSVNVDGTDITILGDTEISTLFVTSRPFDGGTQATKRWQAFELEISDAGELPQLKLDLRFGKTIKEIEAADWTEYDASLSDAPVHLRAQSVLAQFRIRDTAPSVRWKLTRVSIYGRPMTGRRL